MKYHLSFMGQFLTVAVGILLLNNVTRKSTSINCILVAVIVMALAITAWLIRKEYKKINENL